MKTLPKALIAVTFGLLATAPVFAGHGHHQDRLIERLERQHDRIEQGIQSDELTRKEARILKKQHRRLHQLVREFRDDGRLSKKERRILNHKLDKASRQIREFKHNRLNRYVDWHKGYGDCCDRAIDQPDWKKDKYKEKRYNKPQVW